MSQVSKITKIFFPVFFIFSLMFLVFSYTFEYSKLKNEEIVTIPTFEEKIISIQDPLFDAVNFYVLKSPTSWSVSDPVWVTIKSGKYPNFEVASYYSDLYSFEGTTTLTCDLDTSGIISRDFSKMKEYPCPPELCITPGVEVVSYCTDAFCNSLGGVCVIINP